MWVFSADPGKDVPTIADAFSLASKVCGLELNPWNPLEVGADVGNNPLPSEDDFPVGQRISKPFSVVSSTPGELGYATLVLLMLMLEGFRERCRTGIKTSLDMAVHART